MAPTSISAAKDLLRVIAPSDASLEIVRATVSQEDSETSSQVAAVIERTSTTGVGTAVTAEPLAATLTSTSFTGSAVGNLSTRASSTSAGPPMVIDEGFNMVNGWFYLPVPEERISIAASSGFVLRLDATPAVAAIVRAQVVVRVL